ncbi:MAG: Uma2 family endonuclease [Chloroflexi bacterium]|nr:Uma2 family endonuclease [Chloroflexota bacterium]
MVNSSIKFTYEDYKALPESETKRYELLEGELVVVPSPNVPHQSISLELVLSLARFVKDNHLGTVYDAPLDVHLGENVVQPDIMYISTERMGIVGREEIQGAPDLVIEILSPATGTRDRTLKKTLYARHGVRELWIVDPDKETIEVAKLARTGFETTGLFKKGEILTSPVLPGLRLDTREVFPG